MTRRPADALANLLQRPPLPDLTAAARQHGAAVLCVGGAVRDALHSHQPADIDVAVAGDLDAFVGRFAERCGRTPVSIGDAWRDTRRTRVSGVQVDIGVLLGGDIGDDLAARDFTINAMAVRLDRSFGPAGPELLDPFAGLDDLAAKRLRLVSDGALESDPLRALRAVRYVASLPGVRPDEATRAALAVAAGAISGVAAERVQNEWRLLLTAAHWFDGVTQALAAGLVQPTLGFALDETPAARWARFEADIAAGATGAAATEATAGAAGRTADRRDRVDGGATGAAATVATAATAATAGAKGVADVKGVALELRLAALLLGADVDAGTGRADSRAARLTERRWPSDIVRRADRVARWAAVLSPAADLVGWALEDPACATRAAWLARSLAADDDDGARASADALARYARRAQEPRWVGGDALLDWGMRQGPELGKVYEEAARGQIARRWPEAAAARQWARARVGEEEDGGR